MDIRTLFPTKWMTCEDLDGSEVPAEILRVSNEEVGREHENRPVVWFVGHTKGLVLNKTNANTITDLYGFICEEWVGKTITLYPTETGFDGKIVPCIRVRRTAGNPAVRMATSGYVQTTRDAEDGSAQTYDWSVFSGDAEDRLANTANISEVNRCFLALNSEYTEEKQTKLIFDLAVSRREAIRKSREAPPPDPSKASDTEPDADEEWRLFSALASDRIGEACTLQEVDARVGDLNSEYVGEAHAKLILQMAEWQRQAIRNQRGEKSNQS